MSKNTKGYKVEQIYREKIVKDYDQKYHPSALRRLITQYFHTDNDSLQGSFEGVQYHIHAKNITYLGFPWEKYKKRIQLWSDFSKRVQDDYDNGYVPLVIGVYHYYRTIVFVDFEVEDYLDKKTNNSAAHVQTYDLQRGLKEGIYEKTDKNGNHITVFSPSRVQDYLELKLCAQSRRMPLDQINEVVNDFYVSIPTRWEGIECYKYLVDKNHPKQRETEWPGFFHEACFEQYLDENEDKKTIVRFQQNKKKGDLDFDLFYPQINCYGDLKCHSIGEEAIPGNKIENLIEAIKEGPLYYVICEHLTIKDSGPEFVTLNYWNDNVREVSKRGKDIEKQKGRMKAEVVLIDYIIIQIDEFNYKLLETFQKGFKNSDGNPRGEKFIIPEKLMEDFVVRKGFIVRKGNLPQDFPLDSDIKDNTLRILQTDPAGKSIDEILLCLINTLHLSSESQRVTINEAMDDSLLELVVERALFQLRKQGKIKQSRKQGIKIYTSKS